MALTDCSTRRFSGSHRLPLYTQFFWEGVLLTAAQEAPAVLLPIHHFLTNMSDLDFVKAFKDVQALCGSQLKHFHWLLQSQELHQYPLFWTAMARFSVASYPFIPSQVFAYQTDVFTCSFAASTCILALSGWPAEWPAFLEARYNSVNQLPSQECSSSRASSED